MPPLTQTQELTKTNSRSQQMPLDLEALAGDVQLSKRRALFLVFSTTVTSTFVPSTIGARVAFSTELPLVEPLPDKEGLKVWQRFGERQSSQHEPVQRLTRGTNASSMTPSPIRALLHMYRRDERLSRMAPQHRAAYERIRHLRDTIGPVDFDILEALRTLRE